MPSNKNFVLHPRFATDAVFIIDWPLSRVLLMNDARYPWIVLVPRRDALCEFHDLTPADRAVLADEVARASASLKTLTGAAKINIGALGNIVSQLHVHVVARFPGDAAWPGSVWGHGSPEPYAPEAAVARVAEFAACL
jgi:diadenosine tetraphosphate (Ap4A) HIT family hydrolase